MDKNFTENGREIHWQGEEFGTIPIRSEEYPGIKNLNDLFKALLNCWDKDTCSSDSAPMYDHAESPTSFQCTITSILVYDLFGGAIYSMSFNGRGGHRYNVIDGKIIDLTSDQFTHRGIEIPYDNYRKKMMKGDFGPDALLRAEKLKKKLKGHLASK